MSKDQKMPATIQRAPEEGTTWSEQDSFPPDAVWNISLPGVLPAQVEDRKEGKEKESEFTDRRRWEIGSDRIFPALVRLTFLWYIEIWVQNSIKANGRKIK